MWIIKTSEELFNSLAAHQSKDGVEAAYVQYILIKIIEQGPNREIELPDRAAKVIDGITRLDWSSKDNESVKAAEVKVI